ncbi:MAG: T9SS type A sorting domain-containing protein [Bacteroidales bacterium]|nr:T9SS type A sorting domain-containing protein [Bacteroidales bacterium]
MKMKSILMTALILLTVQILNAQYVDVVGKGAYNNPSTELIIDDPSTVDYIVVEAAYKSPDPVDGPVEFVSVNETISADAVSVEYIYTADGTDYGVHPSYFRAVMQPAPSITLNTLNNLEGVHSFVAYIYRTSASADHYSVVNEDHGFFYRNGETNPGVFNIPINTADDVRDITATSIIAEMAYNTRLCVITVTAGDKTETLTLTEPNSGAHLNVEPVVLEDVAGNVDNVQVVIYSPFAWGTGDSFITGNIVVNVEEQLDVCLTNYPVVDAGEDKTVYHGYAPLSHTTISAEAYDGVPPYTYQWSNGATTENICVNPCETTVYTVTVTDANGCVATDEVTVEVVDVRCGWGNHGVLVCHTSFWCQNIQYTVCVHPIVASILLCLGDEIGSCDLYKTTPLLAEIPEFESEEALRDFDKQFYQEEYLTGNLGMPVNEMNVYPNPVANVATVDFSTDSDNTTTIEVYNMMGKKVMELYNEYTYAGQDYQTTFDASSLAKGIYLLMLNNGEKTLKQKVTVK